MNVCTMRRGGDLAPLEHNVAVEPGIIDPLLAVDELLARENVSRVHGHLAGDHTSPSGAKALDSYRPNPRYGPRSDPIDHGHPRALRREAVADLDRCESQVRVVILDRLTIHFDPRDVDGVVGLLRQDLADFGIREG